MIITMPKKPPFDDATNYLSVDLNKPCSIRLSSYSSMLFDCGITAIMNKIANNEPLSDLVTPNEHVDPHDNPNFFFIEFICDNNGNEVIATLYVDAKNGKDCFFTELPDNYEKALTELYDTVLVDVNTAGLPITKYKTIFDPKIWEFAAIINNYKYGIDEDHRFPIKTKIENGSMIFEFEEDDGSSRIYKDFNVQEFSTNVRTAIKAFAAGCAYNQLKHIIILNANPSQYILSNNGEIAGWFDPGIYKIPPVTFISITNEEP